MEELISKYIPKSAPGDHPWSTSGGIVIAIFIFSFLIIGAIFSNWWLSKTICVALIPIILIFGLRNTRQVIFDEKIEIKPLFGRSKTIEYKQLRKFYKHYLGEHGMFIWIIVYQHKSRLKKITFYDDDLNYDEFKAVLNKLIKEHNNESIKTSA